VNEPRSSSLIPSPARDDSTGESRSLRRYGLLAGHLTWQLAAAAISTFAALFYPVRLVLEMPSGGVSSWIAIALSLFFTIDLVLRSMGFGRFFGVLERRETTLSPSGSLFFRGIDVLAAIPWLLLPLPETFSLLVLLKVLHVHRFIQDWKNHDLPRAGVLRIVSLFYWVFLAINWLACSWIHIRPESDGHDLVHTYVNAIYWCTTTLTTVGYGDITPNDNVPERLFVILVEILGVVLYGYVIGTITSVLANINPAKAEHISKLEHLSAFSRYHQLPRAIRRRIFDYYQHVWRHRVGRDEWLFVESLPETLRNEVSVHLNRPLIDAVDLFQGSSSAFVVEIASSLEPQVYLPGDEIVRRGEIGSEMFFMSTGAVDVINERDEVINSLSGGSYFGEIALLRDVPRTASIRARTYCDVFRLDKSTFETILRRFPEVREQIEHRANLRWEHAHPPEDEDAEAPSRTGESEK